MAEVAKGIIDIEINTGSAASALQALQAQINAFNLALNKGNKSQAQFSGEYSRKLQEAINKTGLFTAETIRLETAAATLDKTLSKGKTSLGQYFSARFNKDGAIAAETMALASERARRLQTQFIATSGAAGGFQNALAVRPLAAFSTEMAVAGQRAEVMSAMFKQGTTQLINFGKNVQWAGRQLMVGFTVPLTIFGAVAGKTFMELEKQVVSFKKVYGDLFTTPAELNQNLEAVKGLASEYTKYGIAVKDTIGLAAQAAAAGRKNADLTDAVSQATRLATLGQMDQNAALETTISLQSAFRLSGQDLADTINFLNMVENQTVVSLQDIAAAIPRVAPVISGLGGDVKDLTVFLAAMQEGGVDAAEGANALKSGLASLINPTKQATAMLSGMGINLESIIQMNKGDLMGTVQSFAQALGALDQFSRQQALEQVFGKFQYAKLGALFDNISRKGSQAQQVIATMGYTTEQLGSTADKELKTIEESFGVQLTGAVERFKLAIAPIGEIFVKLAIPLVNLATKFAEAFNGLSDGQKKFAAIGAVVIGVVVPAVTMLTGLFLNLVGTLAKMTQGATLFTKGLLTGGPIGAFKALTQSSKYLSLAEMDAAMAAQQLAGANEVLNATLVQQVGSSNAAATAIGNLTKAYAAMIATQAGAASRFPEVFGLAGASGAAATGGAGGGRAKAAQVFMRGVQRRNSGGPIFMSNGTTVPGTGNTDTVPAMLTPGEFVVNKEATKNNLGLLHSINDSKKPQGLNSGGKTKGMQYFNGGTDGDGIKKLSGVEGGFDDFDKAMQGFDSNRSSQITQRVDERSIGNLYEAFDNSRFMTKQGLNTGILPSWMNEALKPTQSGLRASDLLEYLKIAGPEFLDPTRIAFLEAIDPDTGNPLGQVFDSKSAHSKIIQKLSSLDPDHLIFDTHANDSKSFQSIIDDSVKGVERSTLQKLRSPKFAGSFRISGTGRGTPEAKASIIKEQIDHLNDYYRKKGILQPGQTITRKSAGVSAGKPYHAFYLPDGTHIGTYLPGATSKIPGATFKYDDKPFRDSKIRLASRLSGKKIPGPKGTLVKGLSFALAHLNSGGQVPGYNAGAFVSKLFKKPSSPYSEKVSESLTPKITKEQESLLGLYFSKPQVGHLDNLHKGALGQIASLGTVPQGTLYRGMSAFDMDVLRRTGSLRRDSIMSTTRDRDAAVNIGAGFVNTGGGATHSVAKIKVGKNTKGIHLNSLVPSAARNLDEIVLAPNTSLHYRRSQIGYAINTGESIIPVMQHLFSTKKPNVIQRFYDRVLNSRNSGLRPLLPEEVRYWQRAGAPLTEGMQLVANKGKTMYGENYKEVIESQRVAALSKKKELEEQARVASLTPEQRQKEREAFLLSRANDTGVNLGGKIVGPGNVLRANMGTIVPGTGNTDTVPAMLTPGEFVVNKEATKNNLGLLHQINGSQAMNNGGVAGGVQYLNDGKVVKYFSPKNSKGADGSPEQQKRNSKVSNRAVGAGMAGSVIAGTAGFMLAEKAGIDSMAGQFGASIVAGMVAQKALAAATIKMSKNTMTAAEKTKALAPWLSKVAPSLARFAVPLMGATVGFALLGFGVYKLNKSLVNAEKSGAALSDAMYGSAKTTKGMADAFGRETYATAARRKAAEKAGGQEITQEAVAASGEYMKSESAKQLVKDLELVEKSGEDVTLALRNQLTSSIIAGVISPEEARAIALDIGKELGDEELGIKLSGKLSSLIGVNGERILDNIIEITAEISPTINASGIAFEAQKAFDSLNPGEKFIQFFKGGQESFVENYSIDEISARNTSALTKEAEARALLNLAYQEGTITLKEYLDQEGKITSGATERSKFVENANAQALGFSSIDSMKEAANNYSKNTRGIDTTGMTPQQAQEANQAAGLAVMNDTQGKKAYDAIVTESKDSLKQSFIDAGMNEDIAKTMTDSMEQGVALIDPGIFDKFLSGQIPMEGYDILMRLESAGNLTPEDIDRIGTELTAISTIPNVDKILDFNMSNEADLTEIYDQYVALEKEPDIFKGISIKDQFSDTMSQFGIEYAWLASLPNQEKIILLRNMETYEKYNSMAAAEKAIGDGYVEGGTRQLQVKSAQALNQNKKDLGKTPITPKPEGKGGNSEKNKLNDLKKMLMERFRLQEMLISKEAEGFNKRIKDISREIQLQQRQIALEEKQIEVRQKALEELSKKENEVNTVYDNRISALDRVSASNSRLAGQEQSRITLASALASGDIAGAASAMSDITQQSAESQIEDTKTALELQRQEALKNLTVDVNGTLMTRKGIEASIETIQKSIEIIQTSIYDKNILMQGLEDALYENEKKRLKVAEDREKVETRIYLLEQKKAYDELNKKKNKTKLNAAEKAALDEYKTSYNAMATIYNQQNPSTPVQLLNLGGQVAGIGMRDTVPAMLTPGEFVINKNAAKTFLPMLESINSGVFPSIGGMNLGSPRYDVPANNITNVPVSQSITNSSNASTMYNNSYSINVNVSGSNSSADEIANVVMGKIARSNSGSIRGSRY